MTGQTLPVLLRSVSVPPVGPEGPSPLESLSLGKLRPLLLIGTRPEAIKMAPVIQECRRRDDVMEPVVCVTGQHRAMLLQMTEHFGIEPDDCLDLMAPSQTLSRLTARCIEGIDGVFQRWPPHCLVAQGDTSTVMAAALVAFCRRVPFVHVEAGLRTGNLQAPWPEDLNRRIADMVSDLHCAPTRLAARTLLEEGIPSKAVRVTGNTVIDALLETLNRQRASRTVATSSTQQTWALDSVHSQRQPQAVAYQLFVAEVARLPAHELSRVRLLVFWWAGPLHTESRGGTIPAPATRDAAT